MQLTPLDIILGSELSVRLQLTTTLFDHADVVIIDDGASHDQLVVKHPFHALHARNVQVNVNVDNECRLHTPLGFE
eukprot:CAMPEP_0181206934 /NCGR_PEP_ID=MMETSP1096-20121128/21302_1 /TAXON_ID=156174 ORGANISM="Chrysochromulina ericina, Strain CCMP281" /NCGR_SAMPLE_ID=MMETSP1096 /ASSEMBLY_ACC=CAM_ASM_000453 /LENGTH=75 /DNA_ID=CAMNT_0023297871 /DNA_START=973 /DNA_END=1197 /DNA_ORIENTATION=-